MTQQSDRERSSVLADSILDTFSLPITRKNYSAALELATALLSEERNATANKAAEIVEADCNTWPNCQTFHATLSAKIREMGE